MWLGAYLPLQSRLKLHAPLTSMLQQYRVSLSPLVNFYLCFRSWCAYFFQEGFLTLRWDLSTTHSYSVSHVVFCFGCCCAVASLCLSLCEPMDCSTSGFPVLYYLPEFAQIQVHWVGDTLQPYYPLSSPSPALSLSQHQGLFQWVSSSHQVVRVSELQL